jgi:hypothetical protein
MTESIQRKIKALLDRANHPNTEGPEAEACMEKAEALMQQYRIEESMLNFDRKDSTREPIMEEMDVDVSEFSWALNGLQRDIFEHAGAKTARRMGKRVAVGYKEDLFYANMLWTSIYLDLSGKMLIVWSKDRGFDENVYMLKESGKSWMEIVHAAPAEEKLNKNSGSRLRSAYKRHAEKIGVVAPDMQPRSPKLWRDSFITAYQQTVDDRLYRMREAKKGVEVPEKGAIALRTDEDRLNDEFYRLFPNLHPDYIAEQDRKRREAYEAQMEAMTDKDRKEWERRQKRLGKVYTKTRRADQSAWAAGAKAGSKVDLGGSKIGRTSKELS